MSVRLPILLASASLLAACASNNPAMTRTYDPNASGYVCLLKPFSRSADGSVTKADVRAGIQTGFAAADTNHDGVLGYDEVAALNQANASSCDQTSWNIYDSSGQMRIEQYGARYLTAFEDSDVDLDGIATPQEIMTAKRKPPKPKKKASEPQSEPSRSPSSNPGNPTGAPSY
jgi:hypothetical protein